MTRSLRHILFLCTGNSARSILGEAILRQDGHGRFGAYSAGSQPAGQVNPLALRTLIAGGYAVDGLRSKNWSEFAGPDAPAMDFIITVCDNAKGESCPLWPGRPSAAHWGLEDPAAITGSIERQENAFARTFDFMKLRIDRFLALPLEEMDQKDIQTALREIAHLTGASSGALDA